MYLYVCNWWFPQLNKNKISDEGTLGLQKVVQRLGGIGPQPGIVLHGRDAAQGPFLLEVYGNSFSDQVRSVCQVSLSTA